MYRFCRTLISLIPLSLLLFGCAVPQPKQPTAQTGPDAVVIDGNLHKVDNAAVDVVFLDPTVDFNRFEKILIDPLDVSTIALLDARFNNEGELWELVEEDRAFLASRYRTAMIKNFFGIGGYVAAQKPGPNVLRIRVAISQVGPAYPQRPRLGKTQDPQRKCPGAGGHVGIVGVVNDSEIRKPIARFVDIRPSVCNWGKYTELPDRKDVDRLFESWARLFVYRLQENRKKTAEPGKVW